MRISVVRTITPELAERLIDIWEASVRKTHLFLSDGEIKKIKEYVPQALLSVGHLIIAEHGHGVPIGFMGVDNRRIEMLFLSPDERGRGIGRCMVEYGIENYGINEVTVNEQNPQAVSFYTHMGFEIYKRTDHDEQGDSYPLLYMRLA